MLFLTALTASAQNTIEHIRKVYREVHETIARMMPDEDGIAAMPPEYFDLKVVQNLPGTGPHEENIRMFYGEEEIDYEESSNPYPPHFLRFVTASYNFAARRFYEEYLYDEKGQVMFIYAITPDVADDMVPCELRMWFDGQRLLRFTAKKADVQGHDFGYENLGQFTYREVYSGTAIPELYKLESDRCKQRAQRFQNMFKGIDDNTYL